MPNISIDKDRIPNLNKAQRHYKEKTATKTIIRVFEEWGKEFVDETQITQELQEINTRLQAIETTLKIKKIEDEQSNQS